MGNEPVFYQNPVRRFFGPGAIHHLSSLVESLRPSHLYLVTGSRFQNTQTCHDLRRALDGFTLQVSPPVPSNPVTTWVQEKASEISPFPDLILAIGGGSVMDYAKAVSALLALPEQTIDSLLTDPSKLCGSLVPIIACPTTAGTGSEVTPYSSLETTDQKKVSLSGHGLFPLAAIIDPDLTASMPPYLTASTGFDALSQSIEAFWSVHHHPFSDTHALRAVRLIRDHLENSVTRPGLSDREAMSLASCEAGLAIAHTRTTAVHSVSYPITARFGVPHGHACALTLPSFIEFNAESISPERAACLWQALRADSAEAAAAWIRDTMNKTGLTGSLKKLGIDQAGIETIIREGFRPDRVKNNPRELSARDLREMLSRLL